MQEHTSRQLMAEQPGKSEYIIPESWGQPPASQYRFIVDGKRMYGMRVSDFTVGYSESRGSLPETTIHDELMAWDTLSDEAFLNFEDSLA